jgi:hypothetical protein
MNRSDVLKLILPIGLIDHIDSEIKKAALNNYEFVVVDLLNEDTDTIYHLDKYYKSLGFTVYTRSIHSNFHPEFSKWIEIQW